MPFFICYMRFFTKVLYDMGLSPVEEPFSRLLTQGMVLKMAKNVQTKGNTVSGRDHCKIWCGYSPSIHFGILWRDLEWVIRGRGQFQVPESDLEAGDESYQRL